KSLLNKDSDSSSQLSAVSFSMEEATHYDLTVAVTLSDEIEIKLTYDKARLDETLVKNMAAHFNTLLGNMIDHPAKESITLDLLTPEEKKRIIYDFNDTVEDYPREKTLHGLFDDRVEQAPHRIALTGERPDSAYGHSKRHLTYRCLNDRSNRLAHRLKEKGVQTETIVGIMMNRSVEMIIAMLGI
ncbi:MAG: AMP-binding protein, partial [bacterium]|nr:AMP-binding protein [bacterium]